MTLLDRHVWIRRAPGRRPGWGRIVESEGECYTVERALPQGGVTFLRRGDFVLKRAEQPLSFLSQAGGKRR